MYEGGYDKYLSAKAKREEDDRRHMAVLAGVYKREMKWMRRMPKARGTKAKFREQQVAEMETRLRQGRERMKRRGVKALDKSIATRLGGEVVQLQRVCLQRGGTRILQDFSYTFERGERVGVVGGNGVGKSTFLKMLCGRYDVASGEISVGQTVQFAYFDQQGEVLAVANEDVERMRVIDLVAELRAKVCHGRWWRRSTANVHFGCECARWWRCGRAAG